jgi:hypothetical protein
MHAELIKHLIELYKSKGANPQKIFDNPIFQSLPLQDKLQVISENKEYFSQAPKMVPSKLLVGALASGLGAGAAFLGATSYGWIPRVGAEGIKKALLPYLPAMGVVAGTGALLNSIIPAATIYKEYKNDSSTQQDISNNRYLQALANRSIASNRISIAPLVDSVVPVVNSGVSTYMSLVAANPDTNTTPN